MMNRKERLLKEIDIPKTIGDRKFKLLKETLTLQAHIQYVDFYVMFLRLRYHEEIANNLRSLGYTLPDFNDPTYMKSLDAVIALEEDRLDQLNNLLEEYNSLEK